MATITTTELATELHTNGRTLRKFLRSITPKDAHPGKGSRWNIEKREVRSLRTKFIAWQEQVAQKVKETKNEVPEEVTEVDDTHDEVVSDGGQPTS